MFGIAVTQDVLNAREDLKLTVENLRSTGSTDEQLADFVENGTFGEFGNGVMMLFDSTLELARFVGVPTSCFKIFFMR